MRSVVRIYPDPPSQRAPDLPGEGYGAIAQLGERLLCKQEVVGSIPSGSTIFPGTGVQAPDERPMRTSMCVSAVRLFRTSFFNNMDVF